MRRRPKRSVVLAGMALCLVAAVAVFAPVISTEDPLAQKVEERLQSPNADHLFGTDGFGRDVFSRVVYGSRASLYVGFLSIILATAAGLVVGLASAYRGGWTDLLVQRGVDVLLGFPFLVLALIIVVALVPSPTSAALAIALALAPQIARVARASALSVLGEGYIEAAWMSGSKPLRILWRHMLPNSLPPIIAQVTGYFGVAVVAEATLSFLGLGVPPPLPSWGRMLAEGTRQYFEAAPWVTIFPGIVLSLTVVSFAMLGDGLRDLLDPKRKRSG
jgi:peptide/nickel transport system permease protein